MTEPDLISADQWAAIRLFAMDVDGILTATAKTGRLVVADPAHRTCSAASEIAAIVAEEIFDELKGPIRRITTPDMQIPFSPSLEKQMYPSRASIAEAVRAQLGTRAPKEVVAS